MAYLFADSFFLLVALFTTQPGETGFNNSEGGKHSGGGEEGGMLESGVYFGGGVNTGFQELEKHI